MHRKQLFDIKENNHPFPPAPTRLASVRKPSASRLLVWLGMIRAELHMLPVPQHLL